MSPLLDYRNFPGKLVGCDTKYTISYDTKDRKCYFLRAIIPFKNMKEKYWITFFMSSFHGEPIDIPNTYPLEAFFSGLPSAVSDRPIPSDGCTLYSIHCTLYSVQCTLYTIHCTLYTVLCTLYTVQCTMYNVQCTMCIVHFQQPEEFKRSANARAAEASSKHQFYSVDVINLIC